MVEQTSANQEQQVKRLKRLLEGWRVAVLPLKSVILWEQHWHPCAIVAATSFLYLLIWFLDLNTLASFAFMGLIINLIDFIVPVVCNSLYGPNEWTGQQEKIFEEICKSIVVSYNKILNSIISYYNMRETSPVLYYLISISLLCTVAWVTSSINNIFLLYLISTLALLWPGIRHKGIFNMFSSIINFTPRKSSYFHKSE